MIILHYTGMQSAELALARLCDPASEVSAHYVIEESGRVQNLVPEDRRAWHAGKSYWDGLSDLNSASIGIEIVNPGHEFGYTGFPDRQIKALERVLQDLVARYAVRPDCILGHSDIAPERKVDPGEKFPWGRLARAGLGLWPDPNEMDFQAADDIVGQDDVFYALLTGYGYDPAAPYAILVEAFHRHFCPEKFLDADDPQRVDAISVARLLSLIRQKHDLVGV